MAKSLWPVEQAEGDDNDVEGRNKTGGLAQGLLSQQAADP